MKSRADPPPLAAPGVRLGGAVAAPDDGEVVAVIGWPCGLCGDVIRRWQGPPEWIEDVPFHGGCLHPEVIVVTAPFHGKTVPNIVVGRLDYFEPRRDGGWWLALKDTVDGYSSISINWSYIVKVVLRHDR